MTPATRPRAKSLFWTFAGTFLLVLAAASAVQIAMGITVLRPMAERATRDRAMLEAAGVAQALSATDVSDPEAVRNVIRQGVAQRGTMVLMFLDPDGHAMPDRMVPRAYFDRVAQLLHAPVIPPSPPRLRLGRCD